MPVTVTEDVFGTNEDPFTKQTETIRRFTLSNDNKVSVQVITLGATISAINLPDVNGTINDIALGFDDVAGYRRTAHMYIGVTMGRVCNRVANGKFTLNGQEINVTKNWIGKHQLHGGFIGFDSVHWQVSSMDSNSVTMQHVSADGHEGYPGEVTTKIQFLLTADNCFHVKMQAVTTKPTPINLTNHGYFNLAGHGAGKDALFEHEIMIKANRITEANDELIPTGQFIDVKDTPFDFNKMANLGDQIKKLNAIGYDNNYCLDLNDNKITVVAKAYHPKSGRWMEFSTDQPGAQFYTSINLPDPEKQPPVIGKSGAKYVQSGGFCFETQKYPDSVNHSNFPSVIINPSDVYSHEYIYKFGVTKQ